jgi:hypothetical protein
MSIYLDVVCMAHQSDVSEFRGNAVRVIGEILPFVLARYGLDAVDNPCEVPPEFPEPSVRFTD